MTKKANTQNGTETKTSDLQFTNETSTTNDLQFENQELGNFEFFQFDSDGKAITGKFIGIINDTEKEKNAKPFDGTSRTKKYMRKDITGIVVEEYESKQVFILPNYWQLRNYFQNEIAVNVDFNKAVYRLTRIKKGEGKEGVVIFNIGKAMQQ